jgi:hypothetical protein
MTAGELAKQLLEHPEWDVEVEGTSWIGCSEPERYAGEPDVFEQPDLKRFLIYAT